MPRKSIVLSEADREISPLRQTRPPLRRRSSKTGSLRDKKNTKTRTKKSRPPLVRTTRVVSNALQFVNEYHSKSTTTDQLSVERQNNIHKTAVHLTHMSLDETNNTKDVLSPVDIEQKLTRLKDKLANDNELKMTGILNLSSMNLIDNDLPLIIQEIFYRQENNCTGLILRNNFFSSNGIKILVDDLLLTKTNLKCLCLSNNRDIGDKAIEHLIRLLQKNPSLTLLALPQTGITDYGVRLLADVLCEFNLSLEKLDISFNRFITDQSLEALLDIVGQHQTLKELSIQYCSLSDEALQDLKDAICNICMCPFIKPYRTQCNHCFCQKCIEGWRRRGQTCPLCRRSIERIFPETNGTLLHALNQLLVTCIRCNQSHIRRDQFEIHMSNFCAELPLFSSRNEGSDINVPIMSPARVPIDRYIEQLNILKQQHEREKTEINRTMKILNEKLSEQQNESQIYKQINTKQQEETKRLEHIIEVQGNFVDELRQDNQLMKNQLKNQKSEINQIWDQLNKLIPHENIELEDYIAEHCTFGVELDLTNRNVTDRDIEIIMNKAILRRQCSGLYLRKNQITHQGALIISNILHNNIRLKKLDLSYNNLSDRGIQYLTEGLMFNLTVRELNLGSTGTTKQGVIYLVEMIRVNETLEILCLHKNNITDDGAKLLINALTQENRTLRILSLHTNKSITDKSVYSFIDLLKHNQTLKRVDIFECAFSIEAKTRLRDAAECESISLYI
ncbi:hypothetical protein I4U23_011811 [Adineta vaga]|nr:hypothetical protein I4U23_011811 [Adineta vaga]